MQILAMAELMRFAFREMFLVLLLSQLFRKYFLGWEGETRRVTR